MLHGAPKKSTFKKALNLLMHVFISCPSVCVEAMLTGEDLGIKVRPATAVIHKLLDSTCLSKKTHTPLHHPLQKVLVFTV